MEDNHIESINEEKGDLLNEESYIENHFQYATQGQRFLNWLIDNLLMRYGLSYLSGMGLGFIPSVNFIRSPTATAGGASAFLR